MSVGYAFLLSNGQTSPWHKTRDLVDTAHYRGVWDGHSGFKVVAILRARQKVTRFPIVIAWIGNFDEDRYSAHGDEFPTALDRKERPQ